MVGMDDEVALWMDASRVGCIRVGWECVVVCCLKRLYLHLSTIPRKIIASISDTSDQSHLIIPTTLSTGNPSIHPTTKTYPDLETEDPDDEEKLRTNDPFRFKPIFSSTNTTRYPSHRFKRHHATNAATFRRSRYPTAGFSQRVCHAAPESCNASSFCRRRQIGTV